MLKSADACQFDVRGGYAPRKELEAVGLPKVDVPFGLTAGDALHVEAR
jgi:hypothetical protein